MDLNRKHILIYLIISFISLILSVYAVTRVFILKEQKQSLEAAKNKYKNMYEEIQLNCQNMIDTTVEETLNNIKYDDELK